MRDTDDEDAPVHAGWSAGQLVDTPRGGRRPVRRRRTLGRMRGSRVGTALSRPGNRLLRSSLAFVLAYVRGGGEAWR